MSAAPLVSARSAGLRYGEVVALRDASLEIREGET